MILCVCLLVSIVWGTISTLLHDPNSLMELRRVVDFHLVQFFFSCCENVGDDFQTALVLKYNSLFKLSSIKGHLGCF